MPGPRCSDGRRPGLVVAVFLLAAAPSVATGAADLVVLCDQGSGEVVVDAEANRGQRVVMAGPFPGRRTAEIWIEESCPERRCSSAGACARGAATSPDQGWLVLCNQRSGDVGLVNAAPPPGFTVMAGPFASQGEADGWVAGSCPSWRCEASGACSAGTGQDQVPTTRTPVAASPRTGVLVAAVRTGGPGEAAGFRVGDVLLAVDGVAAASPEQVQTVLTATRRGAWMQFVVEREGQQLTLGALKTVAPLGLEVTARPPPSVGVPGSAVGVSSGWVAGRVLTDDAGTGVPAAGGGATGGWVAGGVTTVDGGAGGTGTGRSAPPRGVVGPQRARPDVTPLASAARAAVDACAFPAALANADQMAAIEPGNPWLEANHDRLRQLSGRQRATEEAVWRASSLLQSGELEGARNTTLQAADTAVSCQSQAVSNLLARIDETIAHQRAEKDAARRRAAGRILAGLLVLNQAVTSQYSATGQVSVGDLDAAATLESVAAAIGGPVDPCGFKYTYPDAWTTQPVCSCAGYTFDPTQFRCAR